MHSHPTLPLTETPFFSHPFLPPVSEDGLSILPLMPTLVNIFRSPPFFLAFCLPLCFSLFPSFNKYLFSAFYVLSLLWPSWCLKDHSKHHASVAGTQRKAQGSVRTPCEMRLEEQKGPDMSCTLAVSWLFGAFG